MSLAEKNQRPVIFEYEEYRAFLADLYSFYKADKSYFSYRYFAKKAGFSSPNFLKLVIQGNRNLSIASIDKFAMALKLTKSEAEFFSYLVQFNQAGTEDERSWFAQKMVRSRGFRKIKPLKQAEYSYYANWYYIPIREMICLKNFQEDTAWIASQFTPHLSEDMVQKALEDLERLSMIHRDEFGRLQMTQKSITTSDEVSNNFVKQYHKEMIKKASDAIDDIQRELREISSVCIPVSDINRDLIKKMIQAFRKEVMSVAAEDEDPEAVYQLNLQWFPIAGNRATGESDDEG